MKTFCEALIEKSEHNFSQNILKLEEDSNDLSEKIVSLQNFAMVQEQKTSVMDTLSSRVNQIDEMRQQSESKTKQEVEERESRNATEMKDMRRKLEFALGELEKHINEEARSLRSDSIDLRKRVENLRDNLAKYEDVIDKKINTDIMTRIEHLDNVVSVYERTCQVSEVTQSLRFQDMMRVLFN
jgi:chromosome segregation ATPase